MCEHVCARKCVYMIIGDIQSTVVYKIFVEKYFVLEEVLVKVFRG